MVASLLLPGCKDDKEVIVSGITVSPATIPALEIGETVELTATITPDYATEEIRWVAYDKDTITTLKAITLESDGRRAILKAVKAGAAKVFVTNRTGVVVSDEVLVTVNSDDYAGFVACKYVGTAELSGALSA